MADEFDPYYAWLGIPPKDQPPNHYRLLGVELFETNLDVIESAAFRQMGHVRTYQSGKHSRESQQLLNELSAAKICLLHPEQKHGYDQQLRATIEAITAFLPDETLDTALPAAILTHDAESVFDVAAASGPSDSVVARTASVSAIRRKRPRPASRIPIVAGVIVAVVCLGVAVMFGSKFLTSEQPIASQPSDPSNDTTTTAPIPTNNPPAQVPAPINPPPVAPRSDESTQPLAVTTPNNAFGQVGGATSVDPRPSTAGASTSNTSSAAPTATAAATHALRFDGNAFVTITNTSNLATRRHTFTAEMWFRCTEPSIKEGYVLMGTTAHRDPPAGSNIGTASGWHVTAGRTQGPGDAQETALRYASAAGSIRGSGSGVPALGTGWHHLAVCNSPADGNFKLDVFLDGAKTLSAPRSLSDAVLSVTDFFLGKSTYLPDRHAFIGDIKAFRLSSDVRYHDPFTPPQAFSSDNTTLVLLNFSGTPSTYAADISGNSRHGVMNGAKWIAVDGPMASNAPPPTTSNTARMTHALRFDGRDSIMIANSRELADTRNSFTAEMWFRFAQPMPQPACVLMGTTAYQELHPEVSNGAASGWYVTVGQRQADSPAESTALRWAAAGGGIIGITGSATPPLGSDWHHLAVCNSPMADGTWRLQVFLDGQLTQFSTRSASEAMPSPSDFFLSASRFITDRHNFFHGDIKAFRLSSNVRYQTTFSPPTEFVSDSATLSLLDFDGKPLTHISDVSGNYRHGIITGAVWVVADAPLNNSVAATPETPSAAPLEDRTPVPSKEERDAGSKKVRDIFASEFDAAKDKAAKLALAKDLLQRGKEEQDSAAKFALLYESRALTLEAADLQLALQATDELTAWFEIDPWTLKCDTLTKLGDATAVGIDRHSIATMSIELADEAIVNSDWESAEKLLSAASRANVRLRDRDILRDVTQKRKQVQTHKKLWEEAERASTVLAESPDDGPANLTLGRYRCFVTGEWDVGLQNLAKGSDKDLAKLAEQDTQGPQGGTALALANQWYEWGEKAPESDKNGALLRARHWYTSALPSLSGLDRTVATKKLEELSEKVEEASANSKQLTWLDGPVGELKRLEGHTSEVTTLDVSRSGTMLVSGSTDGTVRVWNLADGTETGQIRSSVSRISKVALIRDDQFVLVVGSRTTAEIWNVRTGKPATSMTVQSSIRDAALSDDDKIFACARSTQSNGNITLYNMGTGAAAGQLNCPAYPTSVTLSRTGRLLAAGSGDNNVYVWNLASGQLAAPFTGLGNNPDDIAISPNEQLVAASVSNQVMIWELATGKLLSRFTAAQYPSQLVFSSNSQRLLSAGMMHQVSIINVEDGNVIQTLSGKVSNSISMARAVIYLPDPRGAVSAGYDGVIRVWRLPD